MSRFNPFVRVKTERGAPMGRAGDDINDIPVNGKLYTKHCGGDGYYDRGGVYWGHGRVVAVYTRGGAFCVYIEASTTAQALKIVEQARAETR
jgi:hypothetical protein